MTFFRKNTDYAVRVLVHLSMQERTDYISATVLAKELGLPLNFLRRICSTLIKAGILDAREGPRGGIRLVKNAAEITVLELIELFDGKPELSSCTFRKKLCPNRKTCVVRKRILAIEDIVTEELAAITIQTLIDDIHQSKTKGT